MAESNSKEVKFCPYCSKKLKKTRKNILCSNCSKLPKQPIDECKPESLDGLIAKNEEMIFCYNCQEELFRDENLIECVDGCEMVKIRLRESEPPPPSRKAATSTPSVKDGLSRSDQEAQSRSGDGEQGVQTGVMSMQKDGGDAVAAKQEPRGSQFQTRDDKMSTKHIDAANEGDKQLLKGSEGKTPQNSGKIAKDEKEGRSFKDKQDSTTSEANRKSTQASKVETALPQVSHSTKPRSHGNTGNVKSTVT